MNFAFTVASLGRRQRLTLVGEQAFAHLGFLRGVAVGIGNFLSLVVLAIGLGGLNVLGLAAVGGLAALVDLAVLDGFVGLDGLKGFVFLAGLRVVTFPLAAAAQLNGDPVVPQAVLQLYLRVRDGVTRSLLVGLDDHRLPVDGVAVVNPVFLHQNL